jgi:hypothetical protein
MSRIVEKMEVNYRELCQMARDRGYMYTIEDIRVVDVPYPITPHTSLIIVSALRRHRMKSVTLSHDPESESNFRIDGLLALFRLIKKNFQQGSHFKRIVVETDFVHPPDTTVAISVPKANHQLSSIFRELKEVEKCIDFKGTLLLSPYTRSSFK